MKLKDSGTEVTSIWKWKGGEALVELSPKATNKNTLCNAVKGLPEKESFVSCLEPKSTLEIYDLDYLVGNFEVEVNIKREYPRVSMPGITSVNFRC